MALSNHGTERTNAGTSLNSREMQQAYEIRAALEEVGGRAAASVLKGNTAALRRELDAMRAAFDRLDLDSFVQHDIAFHRNILQASQNEVLLRVWDSLGVDLKGWDNAIQFEENDTSRSLDHLGRRQLVSSRCDR